MNIREKIYLLVKKFESEDSSLESFQINAENFIYEYMQKTEYKEYVNLLKEITFLIHYSLAVLKDDCIKGEKVLKGNITKIDDYVFSKYRRVDCLQENLAQLKLVACSNRFHEDPHQNLFAYYLFIEEVGIEIIDLFTDFYEIMENKSSSQDKGQILKYIGNNNTKKTKDLKNVVCLEQETILTEALTNYYNPFEVQQKIKIGESKIHPIIEKSALKIGHKHKDI